MNHREEFVALIDEVAACRECTRMCDSVRVFNHACGEVDAPLMFIGEAPGRLGADQSAIPFHGDKAGNNFEDLLDFAGLSRYSLFITNAVLCNPKNSDGNNATPVSSKIEACSRFLRKQINIIQPKIVVTLGAVALKSCNLIKAHGLSLSSSVRTSNKWYGRLLVPLYHPGQRAMIHRNMANQRSDYRFVSDLLKKANKRIPSYVGNAKADVVEVVNYIVRDLGSVSYFAVHKLLYLAELMHVRKYETRLTSAYFVRQKDGPYCTDLHPSRLRKGDFNIVGSGASLRLVSNALSDLFGEVPLGGAYKNYDVVDEVLKKYGSLPKNKLKTAAYMSGPMRNILRAEMAGVNLYNAPIKFI